MNKEEIFGNKQRKEGKVSELSIEFQPQEARDLLLALVKQKGGEVDTKGMEMGWGGPQATSDWDIFLATHLGIDDVDACMLHSLLDNLSSQTLTPQKMKDRSVIRKIIESAQ